MKEWCQRQTSSPILLLDCILISIKDNVEAKENPVIIKINKRTTGQRLQIKYCLWKKTIEADANAATYQYRRR